MAKPWEIPRKSINPIPPSKSQGTSSSCLVQQRSAVDEALAAAARVGAEGALLGHVAELLQVVPARGLAQQQQPWRHDATQKSGAEDGGWEMGQGDVVAYTYTYIHIYMCVCIMYIYIYIYLSIQK